jgi:hypothetical protein
LINKGNAIVEQIEGFKQVNGRLPNSLSELGIQQNDLFYSKWDSVNYMVWFGSDLGESKTYYSDTKKWEDIQRSFR